MYFNLLKFDLKRLLSNRATQIFLLLYAAIGILPALASGGETIKNNAELLDYINFYNAIGWIMIAAFAANLSFGNDYSNKTLALVFTVFPKRVSVIIIRVINITILSCIVQLFNYSLNILGLNIAKATQKPIHYFDPLIIKVYAFHCISIFVMVAFATAITLLIKNGRYSILVVYTYKTLKLLIGHFVFKDGINQQYLPFRALEQAYLELVNNTFYFPNNRTIHNLAHVNWTLISIPLVLSIALLAFASLVRNRSEA